MPESKRLKGGCLNKTDVSGRKSQLRGTRRHRRGLGLGGVSLQTFSLIFLFFSFLSPYLLTATSRWFRYQVRIILDATHIPVINSSTHTISVPSIIYSSRITTLFKSGRKSIPIPFCYRPTQQQRFGLSLLPTRHRVLRHVAAIANADQVCFPLLSLNAPNQNHSILMKSRLILIACATFLRLTRSQGHHGMEFGQFRIREPHRTTR